MGMHCQSMRVILPLSTNSWILMIPQSTSCLMALQNQQRDRPLRFEQNDLLHSSNASLTLNKHGQETFAINMDGIRKVLHHLEHYHYKYTCCSDHPCNTLRVVISIRLMRQLFPGFLLSMLSHQPSTGKMQVHVHYFKSSLFRKTFDYLCKCTRMMYICKPQH